MARKRKRPTEQQYRDAAAQMRSFEEFDITVDNDAEVKLPKGEHGAWVAAWVWVLDADASVDYGKEDL